MSTLRRLVKNFFSLVSARIISASLGCVVTIYLARVLEATNFGKICFAQAALIYFKLIANLGLAILGVREVARNRERIKNYLNNILTLRLFLTLISFLLLTVFVIVIPKSIETKYLILLYSLSLLPYALLIEWVFQGIERMEFVGISRILNNLLYALLVFLLVKNVKQLLLIPCLWLLGSLAATGFLIFIFVKQFGRIRLRINIPFWKDLLKQSLPMGAAFIMIQVYYSFDTVMLGFVKGNEVVGWYNAAYKIILFLVGFAGLFGSIIFPPISKYFKESVKKLEKFLSYSSKLTIFISLPLAVGGTILAPAIMNLLYGSQYNNGIIAFQILIWSVFTVFANIPFASSLLACYRQKEYLYSVSAGAMVNIILNLYLIPRYSLIGAAVATIVAEIIVLSMLYHYSQKIVRVRVKKNILKPLTASLPMGIFIYFAKLNLFIEIAMGMAIYLLVSLMIKEIAKEDLALIKGIVQRKTIEF